MGDKWDDIYAKSLAWCLVSQRGSEHGATVKDYLSGKLNFEVENQWNYEVVLKGFLERSPIKKLKSP